MKVDQVAIRLVVQSVIDLDLMVMNPQADAADFLPVADPLPAETRALLRPGVADLEESQNASVQAIVAKPLEYVCKGR